MSDVKKTKKDYLNELASIPEISENEELATFIANEIELLDKRAAKAKERAEKNKTEGDELKAAVVGALNSETFTVIADIVAAIEIEDVTPAKVTARLTSLVKDGVVVKEEVKTEKGRVMGYKIA